MIDDANVEFQFIHPKRGFFIRKEGMFDSSICPFEAKNIFNKRFHVSSPGLHVSTCEAINHVQRPGRLALGHHVAGISEANRRHYISTV